MILLIVPYMGLIHWELKRFINPPTRIPVEINYMNYGKKLIDKDLEIFNNITDELINKLRSKIKLMFSFALVTLIALVMAFFSPQRYELQMINLSFISVLVTAYPYLTGSFVHDRIGIYERSWIKFLQQKQMLTRISWLQNIKGRTTSIVLPSVKSYLEKNNIHLTFNETI